MTRRSRKRQRLRRAGKTGRSSGRRDSSSSSSSRFSPQPSTILLVVDDKTICDLVRQKLEQKQFKVETASSSEYASPNGPLTAAVVHVKDPDSGWRIARDLSSKGVIVYGRGLADGQRTLQGPSQSSPFYRTFVRACDSAYRTHLRENGFRGIVSTQSWMLSSDVSALEALKATNRDDPTVLRRLGNALRGIGDYSASERELKLAIQICDKSDEYLGVSCDELYLDLAETHIARQEPDLAIDVADRATNGKGRRERVIGTAHLQKKNLGPAIASLRAARRKTDSSDARLYLLAALAERGRPKDLTEAYRIFQSLFQNSGGDSVQITEGGIVTELLAHEGVPGPHVARSKRPRQFTTNAVALKMATVKMMEEEVRAFEVLSAHRDELITVMGSKIRLLDYVRLLRDPRSKKNAVLVYPFLGDERVYVHFKGLQGPTNMPARFQYGEMLTDALVPLEVIGTEHLELDDIRERPLVRRKFKDGRRGVDFHTFMFLRALGFVEKLVGNRVAPTQLRIVRDEIAEKVSSLLLEAPEWTYCWFSDGNVDNFLDTKAGQRYLQ